MNNEMMYQMFINAMDKMNDKELENVLAKVKSIVSPEDYEKLLTLVNEKKKKEC